MTCPECKRPAQVDAKGLRYCTACGWTSADEPATERGAKRIPRQPPQLPPGTLRKGAGEPREGKRNKFNAKAVRTEDGYFRSTGEEAYWQLLKLRQNAGEICQLEHEHQFKLHGKNGGRVGTFKPDYLFVEWPRGIRSDVAVDFKSGPTRTADYKLRVRLFKDNYPHIEFREVTKEDLSR